MAQAQMSDYDPKNTGAKCDQCPLQTERLGGPVPPELTQNTYVMAIGQEPGGLEAQIGRTLCGPAGQMLDQALSRIGRSRGDIATTCTVLCQPPGNGGIKQYEKRLATRNKKRVQKARREAKRLKVPFVESAVKLHKFPTQCCHPRLVEEATHYPALIPLGAIAAHSVLPDLKGGIKKARGTMFDGLQGVLRTDKQRIMPTVQPGFVMRQMEYLPVFENDLARAFRYFEGKSTWTEPEYIYQPTVDEFEARLFDKTLADNWPGLDAAALAAAHPCFSHVHTYDVETNSIFADIAKMHCLGIGTSKWVMVIQWLSIEEDSYHELMYSVEDTKRIFEILRRWATDPNILKTGWNSGSYDRITFECSPGLNVKPAPHIDYMLLKKNAHPNLPHDLQFSASIALDITNWKGDHHSRSKPTNQQEQTYNAKDVVATARLAGPFSQECVRRGMTDLISLDHQSQSACVGMHYNGMGVDQTEVRRLEQWLTSPGEVEIWGKASIDPYGNQQDPANYKADKKGNKRKKLKKGMIPLWLERSQGIVARDHDLDLTDVVKRSKKKDAINAEKRQAMLNGMDGLSEQDKDEEWQLPTAAELGLDQMAFNPFSYPQVRAVLFEQWDLPLPTQMKQKDLFTGAGEISTGDAVLRNLLMADNLEPRQRKFIHALRMARRYGKQYGTYVRPFLADEGRIAQWKQASLVPGGTRVRPAGPGANGDYFPVPYPLLDGSRVWSDGRLHSSWGSHIPITGRFSSSKPNVQNLIGSLKTMIVAQPGMMFVKADLDQLEMRIAASLWGAGSYLEAFDQGLDPHQITMRAVFGQQKMMNFVGAPSTFGAKNFAKKSSFEAFRKLAKAIQYACQYGATLETAYRLITAAEDKETGELFFADLSMQEVAGMVDRWLKGCPEFKLGWGAEQMIIKDSAYETGERFGYTRELATGRRRDYFQPGANLSEEVNFRIQSTAAGMMNIMLRDIVKEIPFGKWGPGTGAVNQCHDEITVECPIEEEAFVAGVLERHMNVMRGTYSAFSDVDFTAGAESGVRWAA